MFDYYAPLAIALSATLAVEIFVIWATRKNATKRAFNIFLNGILIETVYYVDTATVHDVERTLVNYEGYHPSIFVQAA